MMFFHDDIICRSCGKQYKYRAWANKHFWNCKVPNESHIAEKKRQKYYEVKFLRTVANYNKLLAFTGKAQANATA